MPPKTPYPTPKLRFHNGAWKIVWSHNGKQFSVSTGLPEKDKVFAERWRAEFAVALQRDTPAFPSEYRHAPGVVKYVECRYGVDAARPVEDTPEHWIANYCHEIRGKNTPGWVRDSRTMLITLENAAKGLHAVTERHAAAHLADIAAKRTAGTHNRTLTVFKKFYSWLVNTRRHDSNPFAAIKRMKEGKDTPIVYCTPAEREEIIGMARTSGWPDWLAVPLAFYGGMRREEISRRGWPDVRFGEGLIVIQKSKSGKSRVIPLASALEAVLLEIPAPQRRVTC